MDLKNIILIIGLVALFCILTFVVSWQILLLSALIFTLIILIKSDFTPLEKVSKFNQRLFGGKVSSGLMPPSVQTAKKQDSLTGFIYIVTILVLFLPITRFPVISEYIGQIKFIIFSTVLFIWLIRKNHHELYALKNSPFGIFFGLFVLLMAVNIVFSLDRYLTLNSVSRHVIEFGFFYLFLDIFQDKKVLESALRALILSGVFVSFVSIMQYLIYEYKMFPELGKFFLPLTQRYGINFYAIKIMKFAGYRSIGTFYHPNLLGAYLSMVIPMTAVRITAKIDKKTKLILFVSIILMVTAILCSRSRGSFLSLLVSACFILIFLWKHISKTGIFLFGIFGSCVSVVLLNKIIFYLRLDDILSYRDLIWDNALKMIGLNPFTGIGLGVFYKEYVARYGIPSLSDFQTAVNDIALTGSPEWLQGFHAHNLFLNYSVELGLLIIPCLLLFYFIFFKEFFSISKKNVELRDYCILVGSAAVVLGNFVHSFFESSVNFYDFTIGITFVLVAAMGMVYPFSNSLIRLTQRK